MLLFQIISTVVLLNILMMLHLGLVHNDWTEKAAQKLFTQCMGIVGIATLIMLWV